MQNFSNSCSSAITCGNCTQFGCIWCGDTLGCHAAFSPYGCIEDLPCDNIKHCMRNKPKDIAHKDYTRTNPLAAFITVTVAVVIVFTLWITAHFITKYREKQLNLKRRSIADVQLENFINDPYAALPSRSNSDNIPSVVHFEVNANKDKSVLRIGELRDAVAPPININKDKCVIAARCFACFVGIIIVFCAAVFILLFPKTPQYYLCNTETDWYSTLYSLSHGSLQTQYDNLITVENNNYFSVKMSDIKLRFFHNGAMIAHYYSKDDKNAATVYIPSHSLTDIMVPITFDPAIAQSYNLYELYQHNNLTLDFDFFADTTTYLFNKERNLKLLDYHLTVQSNTVIGEDIMTDTAQCNCPFQSDLI